VVGDSDEVTVKLWDGGTLPARVVQKDEGADIALLKVEAKGLQDVPIGDSEDLKVGHWVLAIGSPFGLAQTVSSGIVSAVGRSGLGLLPYENFIQTDAAINQGNSGGALVDLRGRLVGINTAVFSNSTGANLGIGFAVPINLARALIGKWIQGKTSNYLGIKVSRLDPDAARYFGLDGPRGALVEHVLKGSPAERDGLLEKDVLLTFGEVDVRDESHFRFLLAQADPSKPIDVDLIRDKPGEGRTRLKVRLELSDRDIDLVDPPKGETPGTRMLGITVMTLHSELSRRFDLPEETRGVAVIDVEANSSAEAKGLREGDVIIEVNGREVKDVAALQEALAAKAGDSNGNVVMLRLLRNGENIGYKFLPR
jgi:serine protease Do